MSDQVLRIVKLIVIVNAIIIALSVIFSPAKAEAYTYHYTGITGTAKVAHVNGATMRMDSYPTVNCSKAANCFAVAWVLLWDNGTGSSGQYAEAGIGFQPGKCPKSTPVKLWWASPQVPGATTVGCVPLGTAVAVSMLKDDGRQEATVVWEYGATKVVRTVPLPGWLTGPGIHPAKVEVYTSSNYSKPYPLDMTVQGFTLYPYETAYFQETAPYLLQPGATLQSFRVKY